MSIDAIVDAIISNAKQGGANRSGTLRSFEASTNAKINAAQANTFPFRYICALEFAAPPSKTSRTEGGISLGQGIIGTCTLVGPRAVLTAAHVVEEFAPGGSQSPARLRISPGRAGRTRPFGSVQAHRVILPGKWRTDPTPGSANDFAMVIVSRPFPKTPGYWSEPRAAGDKRGSVIGALTGWRPGHFKVNHSGYPNSGGGFQTHWFSDTFSLLGVRSNLLFIDSQSRQGESGSPVWVTRHRSLNGRHLWAMVVSAPEPSSPGGAVRELEALMIKRGGQLNRFINRHRRKTT